MEKIQMEYMVRSSMGVLFNHLSTPSGLSEWFADDVTVKDGNFIFTWEGADEEAEVVSKKDNDHIRFHWLHLPDETYFEFKLKEDNITSGVALVITDFVEEDEEEEARMLWDKQINDLFHILGT